MALYPRSETPVKAIEITKDLSVGLFPDGKIMTIIHGKPFVQCRKAVVVAKREEDIGDRLRGYRNMDEFLGGRNRYEVGLDKIRVDPEEELFVHASNIQAWVETGYDVDVIDSRIAFPILVALQNHDDAARVALYHEFERRWVEGNRASRQALVEHMISVQPDGSALDPSFFFRIFSMMDDEERAYVATRKLPYLLRMAVSNRFGKDYEDPKMYALRAFLGIGAPEVIGRFGDDFHLQDTRRYIVLTDTEATARALGTIEDDLENLDYGLMEKATGVKGFSSFIYKSLVNRETFGKTLIEQLLKYAGAAPAPGPAKTARDMASAIREKLELVDEITVSDVLSAALEVKPGLDEFAKMIMKGEGRGKFISMHDATESVVNVSGMKFYIYRMR